MERCLERGAGSGEGVGGGGLNSISSMGLKLKSVSGSGGSVGGGCCSCGPRPTNDWKTDPMKHQGQASEEREKSANKHERRASRIFL